jgi:hypothetical protein
VIAALYVEADGAYVGLPGVDPWDERRDARRYAGPRPVVAHPPCQRWGRFWGGNPCQRPRLKLGDDGGCFKAALDAVRQFGGVLEHPEASHAWAAHGLNKPPKDGGWIVADFLGGWTCCVEQGHYGHLSRKATWLYAHSVSLPELKWGPSHAGLRVAGAGFHSKAERDAAREQGTHLRTQLPMKLRNATPPEFRDVLIAIARSAAAPLPHASKETAP